MVVHRPINVIRVYQINESGYYRPLQSGSGWNTDRSRLVLIIWEEAYNEKKGVPD